MEKSLFGLHLSEVYRTPEIQSIALYLLYILKAVSTQFICREYRQIIQEPSANNNQESVRLKMQTAPVLLPSCRQQQCIAEVLGSFPQIWNSRRRFCYSFPSPAFQGCANDFHQVFTQQPKAFEEGLD